MYLMLQLKKKIVKNLNKYFFLKRKSKLDKFELTILILERLNIIINNL